MANTDKAQIDVGDAKMSRIVAAHGITDISPVFSDKNSPHLKNGV
jgi:hypothetical protein